MQKWVVICLTLLTLSGADDCPDGRQCEKGQTCCSDPANGYECCPFEQAECCGDHTHCCPGGTVCDSGKSSCVNATVSIPWVERANVELPKLSKSFRMIKPYMGEDEDNVCPDQSRCPPEFSCLKALRGFSCCPIAQGVSCLDGKHCCPAGRRCSADSRSCIRQEPVTSVSCSDGVSECPLHTTCCETPEDKWGCCPMPMAVCCEDKLHCCPEGTTCDIQNAKCISLTTRQEMPMWAKLPARMRAEWENKQETGQVTAVAANDRATENSPEVTPANKVSSSQQEAFVSSVTEDNKGNNVPCNDTAACLDGNTCCKTKDGGWACCPLQEAVCCEDFIHCCPKGMRCNLAAQSCEDDKCSVPLVKKMPTVPRPMTQVGNVPCDPSTSCPDNTTCCKTKDGGWACCPLPEAVCCDDFIHCCPKGTTCNVAAGSCDEGTRSVPWMEKEPAVTRESVKMEDVPCDSSTSCPDGTTCCKTKDGGWACCLLPEAVCCDDFIHCCPKGTTCNVPAQSCDEGTRSVPWMEKKPAVTRESVKMEDVPCDSSTSCPDNTTCCKTKDGDWACCPLPEAICCDDFIHCCPKGTTCNVPAQSCDEGTRSVPWLEKEPAVTRESAKMEDVPCDSSTSCPDSTTCCKTKDGGWACCPLPQAVCCDDHEHCCPAGTTCDLATLSCKKASSSTPMEKKLPAFVTPAPSTVASTTPSQGTSVTQTEEREEGNQCDAHTSCPKFTTCCFMASSQEWGCCPLPEAVCCANGRFCCPTHYKCDEGKMSCVKGEVVIPWYTKLPATVSISSSSSSSSSSVPADLSSVQCDVLNKCPERTTCCRLFTGEWGCCPLQNAVCCSDKEHCCPQGFSCDVISKSCQRLIMLQLETVPLTPVYLPEQRPRAGPSQHRDVQCDAQIRCRDTETCCRTSATSWGCCPTPNAVCCSDMKHCCPNGYTCTTGGSCTQNTGLLWHDWDVFPANRKRALIV